MAKRQLKALISKIENELGHRLSAFASGIEPAQRAPRVLGFVISSDFVDVEHRDRQKRLSDILEAFLTEEELVMLGPIATLTPAEASIIENDAA